MLRRLQRLVHVYGSVSTWAAPRLPCLILCLKLFWSSGSLSFLVFFTGGRIHLP